MEAFYSTVASARARYLVRAIATLIVAAILLLTGHAANASPLATNTPTSAAHLASDPLAGRFGSTRADFETAYGEPLDEASQPPPFGVPYAISDYGGGTAYAYFDDDRLIYLTFVPEDGFRAMIEILDILEAFLPSDYANGWMGDETDVSFVINVQSADLAEIVGTDVYEKYDAGMWVGDLHAFALGTRDGDLTSIGFGLGWGAQDFDPGNAAEDDGDEADGEDRSDADEEDVSSGDSGAAEAEYLATLNGSFEELSDSIDDFYTLVEDPNLDLSDTATTFDLTEIFAIWLDAYQESLDLTPPSGYEEIHEAYLGFTDALAQAATSFTTDFDAVVAELERAEEQAEVLLDLLEDASRPAFFDIKSGYAKP